MTTNKASLLREAFASQPLVRVAGAHTGVSAKLVELNGFDAVWASGLEISTCYTVPDASILTMTDLLEAARVMNDSTNIPVVADCDSGFGELPNVQYMVRRYEAAGIAAVCIEDKRFPKLNSFIAGDQTQVTIQEFVDKIRMAKDTQRNPDFAVIARIETLIAGRPMEEALERAHAYAEAGADYILIHSKKRSPGEVFEFARRWQARRPLFVVPTTYYETTAEEISAAGIKAVIYANHAIRAAVKAMDEALAAIREGGSTAGIEGRIAPLSRLFELQGMNGSIG